MRTQDVVIAGAGIIGLSAALELATAGLSVTVVERGAAMREASWAAAGMLAAADPENPSELRELSDFSLSLYPKFLRTVELLSGRAVPMRTRVTLEGLAGARSLGSRSVGLSFDREALQARLPDLLPGAFTFLSLEEWSLDPRDLCEGLPRACRAAGVTLDEQTAVEGVQQSGDGLEILTDRGELRARHYIHCGGAWSGLWPGKRQQSRLLCELPVEPRKGQIFAVTMPRGAPALSCVIRTPTVYLVPRGDGRIVVGATVEHAGFDRSVAQAATADLLSKAAALWPPIRHGIVTDCWTGLRPSTPDGLPVIDRLSGLSGLGESGGLAAASRPVDPQAPSVWMAAGHFRNGILLGPGTARILRQLIQGEEPAIDLRAYSAARFATIEAAS